MKRIFDFVIGLSFDESYKWFYLVVHSIILICIVSLLFVEVRPLQNISELPRRYRYLNLEVVAMRVPDGDGFDFVHVPKLACPGLKKHHHARKIRARLAGIDAPETGGQALAEESQNYLQTLILNKQILINPLGIDRYGRLLVMAWKGNININQEMVRAGYAVVYRENNAKYGKYYTKLNSSELFAKKRSNGIWGLENMETPGEFKRRKRMEKILDASK